MSRGSLRRRIALWFTATVTATLGCVVVILHLRIQEETMSQVAREMENTATVFESQHRVRAENVLVAATLLGDSPRLGAALAGSHGDPATLTDVADDLEQLIRSFDVVIVTDAQGIVVGDSRVPIASRRDDSGEESVRQALQGRQWSGTIVEDRRIYQYGSAPVHVGDQIWGTVRVGHVISDSVAQKLKRETECDVTFFVGRMPVASSLERATRVELRAQLSDGPSIEQWARRGEPFILRLGGTKYLSFAQPLNSPRREVERSDGPAARAPGPDALPRPPGRESDRIYYLIQKSLDEALKPYQAVQQFVLGIGVLGILCALVVSYVVAAGIADPLLQIVRAAEALGRGDWSQRVEATWADEVGVLARTFNTMAAKLQSWDAELRRAVAERTAELRATVARLDAAFDQMRRFNADASHELRTPLTIVRGEAEVALRAPRSQQEYESALQSILEESERMAQIIENLLLLARADSGELTVERKRLALHDLLLDMQQPARVLARRSGVDLDFDVEGPLFVSGDSLRLHQLFLNLLDNATKYTPEGGFVRLTAAPEGDRAVIRVADTGIGIEARDLPHLFDRFFRVDKARSRELGGSGLGLSICKWIAEAHGGTISVASTPGQGSVFTVELPLAPEAAQPETDAQPAGTAKVKAF